MKAKFLLFFTFAFVLFSGYQILKQQKNSQKKEKSYIKNETTISLIAPEILKSKLSAEPPAWMKEQIEEDFQPFAKGFSEKQVQATYETIRKNLDHPWIVRYRILDNQLYRYFPEGHPISTQDCGTEKTIKALLQFALLGDMDFIYSYIDGIPVHGEGGIPGDMHITENAREQAPIFFSAKVKGTPFIVLIPDWRSIYLWWAGDIKSVCSSMENVPWKIKRDQAVWRGSFARPERFKLCQLSLEHPTILNARINLNEQDPQRLNLVMQEGIFGDKISWEEFLHYKYLPIIDGVCCAAPAFQWRLLSNSLTLKQESDEMQWFYRAVKPYVHYLPIAHDLSDLFEKIEWAKQHDAECKAMAENSTQFALNNLMMEDVYHYFYLTLKHYASLQKVDKKQLLQEIKSDPRWVNIQKRKELAKRVKKEKLKGYTRELVNP